MMCLKVSLTGFTLADADCNTIIGVTIPVVRIIAMVTPTMVVLRMVQLQQEQYL